MKVFTGIKGLIICIAILMAGCGEESKKETIPTVNINIQRFEQDLFSIGVYV